jgi:hypothetical protein
MTGDVVGWRRLNQKFRRDVMSVQPCLPNIPTSINNETFTTSHLPLIRSRSCIF